MGENGTAIPTEGDSCTDLKQEQLKLYYKDVRMKQIIYHDLSNFRNGQKKFERKVGINEIQNHSNINLAISVQWLRCVDIASEHSFTGTVIYWSFVQASLV